MAWFKKSPPTALNSREKEFGQGWNQTKFLSHHKSLLNPLRDCLSGTYHDFIQKVSKVLIRKLTWPWAKAWVTWRVLRPKARAFQRLSELCLLVQPGAPLRWPGCGRPRTRNTPRCTFWHEQTEMIIVRSSQASEKWTLIGWKIWIGLMWETIKKR